MTVICSLEFAMANSKFAIVLQKFFQTFCGFRVLNMPVHKHNRLL